MHTLPDTNPLRSATPRMRKKFKRFYLSPFHQVTDAPKAVPMDSLETINPFTLAPWEKRTQIITDGAVTELTHGGAAIRIAVSSSARNGVLGMGGAIEIQASSRSNPAVETFSSTLGTRTDQNLYSGELTARPPAQDRVGSRARAGAEEGGTDTETRRVQSPDVRVGLIEPCGGDWI